MFRKNLKAAFAANTNESDNGSLVETVLLIAGFAIVAILVVTWIGNAIAGQAADVSECITGANSYAAEGAAEACSAGVHAEEANEANSTSDGWTSRFGG